MSSHPFFKIGDTRENKNGYLMVWTGNIWILLHRNIFMIYLGRNLKKDEIIHHRNGNKKDNRLENLQLLVKKNHCPGIETQHSEDIHRLLLKIKILEEKGENK